MPFLRDLKAHCERLLPCLRRRRGKGREAHEIVTLLTQQHLRFLQKVCGFSCTLERTGAPSLLGPDSQREG